MKLWKKLAFTGVSALLVGTLAACGGSGSKEQAEASDSDTLQMYQIGDKPDNFDQLMEVANKRIEKENWCKSQYQLHWLGRLRKENERHHFFRRKLRYRLCEQLCFQCSKRSLC